jgi:hypothetical protein
MRQKKKKLKADLARGLLVSARRRALRSLRSRDVSVGLAQMMFLLYFFLFCFFPIFFSFLKFEQI